MKFKFDFDLVLGTKPYTFFFSRSFSYRWPNCKMIISIAWHDYCLVLCLKWNFSDTNVWSFFFQNHLLICHYLKTDFWLDFVELADLTFIDLHVKKSPLHFQSAIEQICCWFQNEYCFILLLVLLIKWGVCQLSLFLLSFLIIFSLKVEFSLVRFCIIPHQTIRFSFCESCFHQRALLKILSLD